MAHRRLWRHPSQLVGAWSRRAACALHSGSESQATTGDRGRARGHERPPMSPRLVLRRLRRHGARGTGGVRSPGRHTASPTPFHAKPFNGHTLASEARARMAQDRHAPTLADGRRRASRRPPPRPDQARRGLGFVFCSAHRSACPVVLCRIVRRALLPCRYPFGSVPKKRRFFPSRK